MKRSFLFIIMMLLLVGVLLCGCDNATDSPDGGDAPADPCAAGHTFGEAQTTPAQCTKDGSERRVCSVCGEEESKTLPATGHTAGRWQTVTAADCITAGERRKSCTVCGDTVQTEAISATGHTAGEWETVTHAGCDAPGERRKSCTVCGDTVQSEPLSATGHSSGTWRTALAATCTATGKRERVCSICYTVLETKTVAATGHTAGAWQTVTPAGCTTLGEQKKTCTSCPLLMETESIPATGHDSGEWEEVTPAGCETLGERKKTCTVCTAILQTEDISALGHTAGEWHEVALAGGGMADYMNLKCKRCPTVMETKNKEEIVITTGTKQNKVLTGYRIVYPAGQQSEAFVAQLIRLAEAISKRTGSAVPIVPDTEPELSTKKEIVVGEADRASVATAKEKITGFGYAVQVTGNRIVIVGTTAQITQMGVEYFLNTYLAKGTSTLISVAQSAVSDRYNVITLADANGIHYTPVYDADLDTDTANEYGEVNIGTGRDYIYDATLALRDVLLGLTGRSSLSLKTDTATATEREILLGRPNRAQIAETLADVAGDAYAVAVRDGRVVATAWSLQGQRLAAEYLQSVLQDAVYTDGSGQRIVLPVNLTWVQPINENWFTDFEKPALPLHSTVDVGDSSLQYIYMGDGVTLAAYQSYCAKLLQNGYRVLTESNLEGSYFKTLVNASKTVTLQVSYHAFAHKDTLPTGKEYAYTDPCIRIVSANVNARISDYPRIGSYTELYTGSADTTERVHYSTDGGYTLDYFKTNYRNNLISRGYKILCEDLTGPVKYYTARNATTGAYIYVEHVPTYTTSSYSGPAMRILYRSRGVINLPTSTMLSPTQSYTKRTDSAITAVKLPASAVGTGYVITLEDGRFIVIDGGKSSSNPDTRKQLFDVLCDLHTKVWGREPTQQQPIVIAAWHITHSHGDHIGVFWDFAKEGREDCIRLENLIANTPAVSTLYNTGEAYETLRREMTKIHGYFGGFNFIKVHTGQTLYFANVGLEVLYTPGDLAPHNIVTFNDSSVIIRLHFKPTNGDEVTLMSMGDCYKYAARWLSSMYGTSLQSDMVTLSHHGGPGTENTVYDLIAPKVVWWPHAKASVYGSYLKSSDWHCKVDQHVFYDIESVDYVFISDDYNITLFLRAGGPDYDNLYAAAGEGATISYYTELPKTPNNAAKLAICAARPVAVKKKS